MVSKSPHEGQASTHGDGLALRDVHRPSAGSHPVSSGHRNLAAPAVSRCPRSAADPPGAQLPRSRSCGILRGEIHAVSRSSAGHQRVIPSSTSPAHSRGISSAPSSAPTASLAAAAAPDRSGRSFGRQHRLPGEQPTHDRYHDLQADLAPGAESRSLGRLERLRLRRLATPCAPSDGQRTDAREDAATRHALPVADQAADGHQHRQPPEPPDDRIREQKHVQQPSNDAERRASHEARASEAVPTVQKRHLRESVERVNSVDAQPLCSIPLPSFMKFNETSCGRAVMELKVAVVCTYLLVGVN